VHPGHLLMGTQSITHPTRSSHAPLRIALLLLLSLASPLNAQTASVSALTVPLILPSAVVFDSAGNLYLAEAANHVIRKVDTSGHITTIAGTGTQGFSGDSGPATAATLDSPQGLALDTANNLYIADTHNHRIRKLNLTTGTITTFAGTGAQGFFGDNALATAARLNLPTALAMDATGNLIFADTGNHRIRKISTTGIITTIAGTGTQGFSGDAGLATAATIDSPTGLALDASHNLYLADTHNHRIRRIDAATGIITTVAGDGTQTLSGDGGPAIAASLDTPRSTAVSPSALLTLADTGNQRIRQLTAAPAPATTIQTIAGLGLSAPGALTISAPSVLAYGTGQLTATLAATTPATGTVTFLDSTAATATTLGTAPLAANIATFPTTSLPAGLHSLTATYAGDQTHLSAQSPTFALTITPQQLTATIAPITIFYGQPIPGISGTLTGILPQDASSVSASFTTTANNLSPAGAYPITANLTGPTAGNYAIASSPATLTIAPAPTVITLGNIIATAAIGSSLTLTAHVATSTPATPVGSVILLDGANTLFTTSLSTSGDAVYTIASLTQGAHSYTAYYSGSTNFAPSTSTPQLITVDTGPITSPDFTLASTGTTTQTIVSGSSANYTFAVQLQGNISSPITLAATGLPNLSTASFNPPTLPPGSTTNAFSLTIATPNTTASQHRRRDPAMAWAILIFPFAGFTLIPRNRHAATKFLIIAALSITFLSATGCGDRINTADALTLSAKPYTITITGTATTSSGAILQHSTAVTLLLEQPQ